MSNHAAIIAKVEKVSPIEGADRIHLAEILGEFCVVSKDVGVGYVGVLFPADLQLSHEYAHANSLYRHAELNSDVTKKGFFDDNRRVRAQVLRGVRSTAYFASLESLAFCVDAPEATVGCRINTWGDNLICERFISEKVKKIREQKQNAPKLKSIPLFKEHKETAQLNHFIDSVPEGALLSFHAKKHGTSFRVGILPREVKMSFWQKIASKLFGVHFPTEGWVEVVGSRRVVLKRSEKEAYRFEVADAILPKLSKGMQVYGEIVGYVNGKPIMPPHSVKALKDKRYSAKYGDTVTYSYNTKPHEYRFHIYRITSLDAADNIIEWDQQKLENWCAENGLEGTVSVHPQFVYQGDKEALKALVQRLTEREEVLCEDYEDPTHISEGIIMRVDYKGKTTFYKNKSIPFKVMEGILTVDDVEDES